VEHYKKQNYRVKIHKSRHSRVEPIALTPDLICALNGIPKMEKPQLDPVDTDSVQLKYPRLKVQLKVIEKLNVEALD